MKLMAILQGRNGHHTSIAGYRWNHPGQTGGVHVIHAIQKHEKKVSGYHELKHQNMLENRNHESSDSLSPACDVTFFF